MEEKILKYNLEELLEDKQFIAWVLKGYKNTEWNSFINKHPEMSLKAKKAREIIQLLQDTYDVLEEDDVLRIWQNIDKYNVVYKKDVRTIQLRRTFTIAASILIIVSLGVLGYTYFNDKNLEYQFASSNISVSQEEARLVLSDGEQIVLNKDKSTIALNNEKEIVINNENTIDLSDKEITNTNTIQLNEVIVPYGKRSELLLADGTKVWLNAGSRLAFPTSFTDDTREVYLQGEACFKVAKDKSHPFIVNANSLGIKVLGTHFNVAAYPNDDNIETILVEGSVAVTKKNTIGIKQKSVVLKPFQKAIFNKEEKEILVSEAPNADVYIAWTEGWFQFSKQSLSFVFTKLERYYNVKIIVPENFPSEEKITGKLDLKDSLNDVLLALSDVAKIEYTISGEKVFINKIVEENYVK